MEVAFKYIYVLIDAWLVMVYIEYASALIYDELKKVSWYHFSDFVTVRSLTDDHNFFKGNIIRRSQLVIKNTPVSTFL